MATIPKAFAILVTIIASLASFTFGFGYQSCILVTAATTPMMQELHLSEADLFNKLLINIHFCVACFISGLAADTFGRRPTLIASAILSFTGFIVMTHSFSYTTFLVGRNVSLFGIGVGVLVAPLYIGEVAYPSHRGFLNTIPERTY
ncbi:unnamed protein product [Linum trigynum]|uniref:Major facilitator superfamily (MFS) profile domain-containing protein n=1 Tax=Linum trigynum TaxID=586398 RepID=A0AAV2FGQ1_9ROSI